MIASSRHFDADGCPNLADLTDFVAGRGGEATNSRIESHLSSCAACLAAIERLEEHSDAVVQALAAWPARSDDEQEFRRLQSELLAHPASAPAKRAAGRGGDVVAATPPTRLGAYELLEEIGRGAAGVVYRARHVRLDRIFAVKVLMGDWAGGSDSPDHFLREMKAVGQLDHPHVVRATDAGEDQGWHYLVMEYSPGVDVSEVVRRAGQLSIAEACEMARQAALGLAHAHHHGVVHRDVKPSNLLLTADGQVKLLDMGLVGLGHGPWRPAADSTDEIPRGTADYMAPEQWTDFQGVDHRADLYGLGCTLFKMLTGAPPFHALPDPHSSKMAAHLHAEIPRVSALRRDAPPELDRILARLLAKSPHDRHPSASALIEELSPLTRDANLGLLAERIGLQRAAAPLVSMEPRPLRRPKASPPISRRTALASVATATLLGVAYGPRWWKTAPKIQSGGWRALAPVTPALLTPSEEPARWAYDRNDRSVKIESRPYTLVNLGRPVAGQYSIRTGLARRSADARAGIFFRYRERVEDGGLIRDFHMLEVVPADDGDARARRLQWSHLLERQLSPDEHEEFTLWASTVVERPTGGERAELAVTLGVSGFPGILWNGRPLAESAWTLTRAGRHKSQIAHARLRTDYLGPLGLFVSGGAATFDRPELMYHELT